MGEKIVVGPFNKGLRNDRTAFNIDNDSFPFLINSFQWRGRIKRKRGTTFLGRLTRFFNSLNISYGNIPTIILDGTGAGNLLTGFALQANGNIVPGSITITVGANVYTDPTMDGFLTPAGTGGPNTINYATGVILIPSEAGNASSAIFRYFPDLPVMGLEDFVMPTNAFPGTIAFDTKYSYNIVTAFPYPIYDVSFYKNPPADPVNLPGYIPKTNETATTWNGADYQQFWTVNYQGALWATNGIRIPFDPTTIGMQFKPIITVTVTAGGPPAIATLQITAHGLVVGDFLFINEVATTTGINFQTGYVIAVIDANNVSVEFPNATIATNGTGGIAQYLTNRSNPLIDNIRFYDGDPTDGNFTNPTLNGIHGWVNFMPVLSREPFSLADLPEAIYYLVGARMIVPFKDRLLFMGPVVQTSSGIPIYLQDTVIYSQNGTPYYTSSFTGDPSLVTTVFFPILLPVNQTSTATAYWEDQTGFGGSITAGIDEPILTSATNEDVLILGFTNIQTRLVYSGYDIIPFNFFVITSELGSGSTFSSVNLDKGVLSRGERGIIISGQTEVQRIDLEIPDEVFQISLLENGSERFTSQRDFINEWVYFTYPVNGNPYRFPNQTLQYNYREDTWSIFKEAYTHYGQFRKQTGFTWQTVGTVFATWNAWNQPWNAGASTLLQPDVLAGNQQGFVLIRDDGTNESPSLYIRDIVGNTVTSPDHTLSDGDYIIISGALGTIGDTVNNRIFSVALGTDNTFVLNPPLASGTYLGGGVITRMYVPFIQTKQFPMAWGIARKTRLGVQQYLLTKTAISQMTLLIFLSMDSNNPYNQSPIVPEPNVVNSSLVYSTTLYTCPESTNLGLTPANINLNMVTASSQEQIWHRMNTSLLGDTVQIGFTLSDAQMRGLNPVTPSLLITGITQASNAVVSVVNGLSPQTIVRITGVIGMTQVNNREFNVIASSPTSLTLALDSTTFSPYISSGSLVAVAPTNQFAEIELHGIILDVSPSMMLA